MSRVITLMFYQTALGSSPRVWGQDLFPPICNRLRRIIPTRVGTSLPAIANDFKTAYHPHACGDKHSSRWSYPSSAGSSPRVWGQVAQVLNASWNKRIIPTRVGTSEGREPKPSSKEDHPHACGDKSIDTPATFVVRGSSPRVWGQDSMIIKMMVIEWIIPTRVGTRPSNRTVFVQYLDHPHACGDKSHRQQ